MQKFEIPAMLQGGTICLLSLVTKIRKIEKEVKEDEHFKEFFDFLEFEVKIWNSGFVTGWHYMISFSW